MKVKPGLSRALRKKDRPVYQVTQVTVVVYIFIILLLLKYIIIIIIMNKICTKKIIYGSHHDKIEREKYWKIWQMFLHKSSSCCKH